MKKSKLQLFAVTPNTITTANYDVDPRAIDLTSSFASDFQSLIDIMGIMRPIEKEMGSRLRALKVTGELASGAVAEGDEIPLSSFNVQEVDLGDVEFSKHRDRITGESLAKYGETVAIQKVDERFKALLQGDIWAKLYNFLLMGTQESTEDTWQMAIAMAIANVKTSFENLHLASGRIAVFANTIDLYRYLGGAPITLQTAFGRTYIENFLGADIMFVGSDIPQGRVIATPVNNIICYYVNPTRLNPLGLYYTTDAQLPYIGYATDGNYGRMSGENFAVSALTMFAEYLDGIAIVTVDGSPTLKAITVTPAEGSAVGTTKATLSNTVGTDGDVFKYKLGAAAVPVEYGENVRNWSVFTQSADIAATSGQTLTVVEADKNFKAVGSGSAAVVVNDGE